MKWLWIILGTIAALVVLVAIIGAMLPVKHVATKRARFNQPAESAVGSDRRSRRTGGPASASMRCFPSATATRSGARTSAKASP
jgi:hypothetical protein